MTKSVDAVLFDLDQTLVNTSKLAKYRETHNVEGLLENIDQSKLYKPVQKILSEITKKGIKLGLITNSPRWYVDEILKFHSIEHFEAVICYDDVGPGGKKPSPNGINLALKQLGLNEYSNVVYVGDQGSDIEAAYYAGIKPIAPSWASRDPIDQVPAAILCSSSLISLLDDYDGICLLADKCAQTKSYDYKKQEVSFLPLNEDGQVVALNKEDIKLIAFGRYFSQQSVLTATYHENHSLSKDIFAKEHSETYVSPQYWVELLSRVSVTLPMYIFGDEKRFFDIITVIPSKQGKNPRLENLLKRIKSSSHANSDFIPDLFKFDIGAKGLKTLGGKASRLNELKDKLHVKQKYQDAIAGKTVLIIDDVITTGATFNRAFELLNGAKAAMSFGVCIAKTVSVHKEHKFCPKCERLLALRTNPTTGIHFWACTGYNDREKNNQCIYTESMVVKKCPLCVDKYGLVKQYYKPKDRYFLACTSYRTTDECGYTENVEKL